MAIRVLPFPELLLVCWSRREFRNQNSRDNAESVVLQYTSTTHSGDQALLHSSLELDNSDFWRWLHERVSGRRKEKKKRRTIVISTGTLRTVNQGTIILQMEILVVAYRWLG